MENGGYQESDMNENLDGKGREELNTWIKKQLDAAVWKLIDQGEIESVMVEAKPAWVLPFQILIGKIRARGQSSGFTWFICGEILTDFLDFSVASTPRDAARHFAMKWQLEAARNQERTEPQPTGSASQLSRQGTGGQWTEQAEALYELVEDKRLWLQQNGF